MAASSRRLAVVVVSVAVIVGLVTVPKAPVRSCAMAATRRSISESMLLGPTSVALAHLGPPTKSYARSCLDVVTPLRIAPIDPFNRSASDVPGKTVREWRWRCPLLGERVVVLCSRDTDDSVGFVGLQTELFFPTLIERDGRR